jgi:hypothetical protein
MDYISSATAADPANAAAYAMFGDLFEHKLWHECVLKASAGPFRERVPFREHIRCRASWRGRPL